MKMTQTELEIIEHILYTGEVSKEILKKIIPDANRRYVSLSRWKKDGIYKINKGGVTGYGLDLNRIEEGRSDRIWGKIYEAGIDIIKEKPEKASDRRQRMWRAQYVLSMLYGSNIMYLPRVKPTFGCEFPYTANCEKTNREEIEMATKEGGVYYSAHELKSEKKENGEILTDETLRRNRASGILFAEGGKGYVVYSFPKIKNNRAMAWTREHDHDIYVLVRAMIRGKIPDTIFIGSTLIVAEEIMKCSEEATEGNKKLGCLHLDNIAGGQVYYIPSKVKIETGNGTRLIEYIVDATYRMKIDRMICSLEKCAEPEKDGLSLGVLQGRRYLYNMMDMNLNKLRHAMRMERSRVYCFTWQEEFIRCQMERSESDCEIITYEESEILRHMR